MRGEVAALEIHASTDIHALSFLGADPIKKPVCLLTVTLQVLEAAPCSLAFFDIFQRVRRPFLLDGLKIAYCGSHTSTDQKLDIKTAHGIKARGFGLPQQTDILYLGKKREEKTTQTDALVNTPGVFMKSNFLFQEKADEGPIFLREDFYAMLSGPTNGNPHFDPLSLRYWEKFLLCRQPIGVVVGKETRTVCFEPREQNLLPASGFSFLLVFLSKTLPAVYRQQSNCSS